MNIALTPALERLISAKVASGQYDVQAGFDPLAGRESRTYKSTGRQLAERIKPRGRAARAKKS